MSIYVLHGREFTGCIERRRREVYIYIHTYICAHQAAHLLQTRNLKVGAANEQVMMSKLSCPVRSMWKITQTSKKFDFFFSLVFKIYFGN